ncbi:death-associated inhibitor of apoptosis 2 [Leptinotarsa decemlineata]|uniref:death-associated inhibitor of apoptosis 2 n=1 Tax=Leptinotarsa decemlineata TaxID=7539 RepID=UPI003D309B3B
MDMCYEEHRLQTFHEWPTNAPVDPFRIAKAGFFSTSRGSEVECFACHLKLSNWSYGDCVMARHIALSPTCPFVMSPSTSGNIPTLSSAQVPPGELYRVSAALRLATFDNWPIPLIVTPERLANAGFYYLKEGDNTKCAFCKGVVRAWEPGDDPDLEHVRHFPNCQFVINVIAPRLTNADGSNNSVTSRNVKDSFANITLVGDQQNFHELGVQSHKGPKSLNFVTVESRLRSFETWSDDLIQTPEVLAQAGFYYEGFNDQVRCFHCDGGLRHWDPHDDPWTEHARWFPNCSFVKLVKGQEFVTACANPEGPTPKQSPRLRRSN